MPVAEEDIKPRAVPTLVDPNIHVSKASQYVVRVQYPASCDEGLVRQRRPPSNTGQPKESRVAHGDHVGRVRNIAFPNGRESRIQRVVVWVRSGAGRQSQAGKGGCRAKRTQAYPVDVIAVRDEAHGHSIVPTRQAIITGAVVNTIDRPLNVDAPSHRIAVIS